MTSLSNIILLGQQKVKIAENFFEKESMIERITKLEKMMHDIVSGKIKIRRASSAQASRRVKLDNRVSFRGQFNLGKERSKTEMKGSNKNIVKRDSSKKLTFQQGLRIVEENSKVFPPIKKIGIFPKKTTLKLNQDYRPIREASKQA